MILNGVCVFEEMKKASRAKLETLLLASKKIGMHSFVTVSDTPDITAVPRKELFSVGTFIRVQYSVLCQTLEKERLLGVLLLDVVSALQYVIAIRRKLLPREAALAGAALAWVVVADAKQFRLPGICSSLPLASVRVGSRSSLPCHPPEKSCQIHRGSAIILVYSLPGHRHSHIDKSTYNPDLSTSFQFTHITFDSASCRLQMLSIRHFDPLEQLTP